MFFCFTDSQNSDDDEGPDTLPIRENKTPDTIPNITDPLTMSAPHIAVDKQNNSHSGTMTLDSTTKAETDNVVNDNVLRNKQNASSSAKETLGTTAPLSKTDKSNLKAWEEEANSDWSDGDDVIAAILNDEPIETLDTKVNEQTVDGTDKHQGGTDKHQGGQTDDSKPKTGRNEGTQKRNNNNRNGNSKRNKKGQQNNLKNNHKTTSLLQKVRP